MPRRKTDGLGATSAKSRRGFNADGSPWEQHQWDAYELSKLRRPVYWLMQCNANGQPARIMAVVKSQRMALRKMDEYAMALGIPSGGVKIVRVKQVYPEVQLPQRNGV